jgi:hypothetical protein
MTPISSPTAIKQLKDFLALHSDISILRHVLGVETIVNAPELLKHIIINCVDCESFEHDHSKLTEIGLAVITANDISRVKTRGPYAKNVLKEAYVYHYRLIANAHYTNQTWVKGDPATFLFGKTRFVKTREARAALTEAFNWPIDPKRPQLGHCPVIFLGHALHNDLTMLSTSLGFNSSVFGTVVATMDTQLLARAVRLPSVGHLIGLGPLCTTHGFAFAKSHTAGNDAAYTLFAALYMAMRPEYFEGGRVDKAGKTPQQVINDLEQWGKKRAVDSYGVEIYCERCGRYNHLKAACRARVSCKHCLQANRSTAARTHATGNCRWQ